MDVRRVAPARGPLDARLRAPASKSVTHRSAIVGALASGPSTLVEPLEAVDTRVTREGLRALGVDIRSVDAGWWIDGRAGIAGGATLQLGESGTSMRLLAAVASLGRAPTRLEGSRRLAERPVAELVAAIERLGGRANPSAGGGLPLSVGGRMPRGGALSIDGSASSQFASALLVVGARLPLGLDLTIAPPAVSMPYVELTADVLAGFGVPIERVGPLRWRVAPGEYGGGTFRVDGDHSSASYFLAAASVVGGRVRVGNLSPNSAQPDRRLGSILEGLGCRVRIGDDWLEVEGKPTPPGFDLDLADAPDLAPTLAVVALFADGPSVLRGIAHLRLKESDRLAILARNLSVLGRAAVARDDRLEIGPPAPLRGGILDPAGDHRIAMAFAIAGLRLPGVVISDPGCIVKSHPGFWAQLRELEGPKD